MSAGLAWEWCFVAEDESGARVGRVGYRVEPPVTNPAWLGTLPPAELRLRAVVAVAARRV